MKNNQGFTLIELLIVVAIISILASIAIPSYQSSVTKTRRTECQGMLLGAAQLMEQQFTQNNQYPVTINDPAADATEIAITTTSESGFCTLALTGATTTAFTLTAAPVAPHTDSLCGTVTLDNLGRKGEGGTGTLAECW